MSRGQIKLIGEFKMAVGMWLLSGGRLWSTNNVHSNRNYKGVGEFWYGLRPEGVSCQDCWMRTCGHSLKLYITCPLIQSISWHQYPPKLTPSFVLLCPHFPSLHHFTLWHLLTSLVSTLQLKKATALTERSDFPTFLHTSMVMCLPQDPRFKVSGFFRT